MIEGDSSVPDEETVEVQARDLDTAPTGRELATTDYVVLVVMGVIIPAVLLIWGWM